MHPFKQRPSWMALLLFAIFISLAWSPIEEEEFNSMEHSLWNSLILQEQVLQTVGEQQLLDAESSSRTAIDQETVIALRALQDINKDVLDLLSHLYKNVPTGLQYEEKQLVLLKEYMQELEGNYLDWALKQTKSKEDPRWIALKKNLLLSPLKIELEQEQFSALQARVLYSQVQLAEQVALDIFIQDKSLPAVYWPFDNLQLDWEQSPSFVGVPIQGRIVLGARNKQCSAAVNGELLAPLGKGFYYESIPTALGKQAYELSFRKKNALTGVMQTFSKTVHYEVVSK